jgi:hypothetical protein
MAMFKKIAKAGLLLAFVGCFTGSQVKAQEDTFEWSGRLGDGQVLTVKGIVGSIHAVLASGNQAEVVARKRGARGDFEQVAIEVEEVDDGFIICSVYGSWNHGEGRCLPGRQDWEDDEDRDRHRGRDMDVEVEYEVRVPAGVEFNGGMVSGEIEVRDLRSEVDVSTVAGDIFVSTSGMAWANSVSGDIEVDMGDYEWDDMDFSTVSGDITLWLPDDFGAEIDFNSLSGGFDSDFDLTIRKEKKRKWIGTDLEATIGDGGRELNLDTLSGDVELRRKRG